MSRGVYQIKLIENKNVTITYASTGEIRNIVGGQELTFEHCYNLGYENEINRGENNQDINSRTITLNLRTLSELENVETILDNYYGWLAVVTDYDLNHYAIIDPLFMQETEENYQQGVNYLVSLSHDVESNNEDIDYLPIVQDSFLLINNDDNLLINDTDILAING